MKTESKGISAYTWFNIGIVSIVIIALTLIFYPKSPKARVVKKINYVHGAILDKSLDTRTSAMALVYRNEHNKVFVIRDANLWDKADVGDSVKIGYTEIGRGFFYNLKFETISVIGKAKRGKGDINIFSSPKEEKETVIIPMLLR